MARLSLILELYVALLVMILILLGQPTVARELRPSYHGLEYQSMPPAGEEFPPEMQAFFGASSSTASNPANASASSGDEALPKAMNANDTAWWNSVNGDGVGRGGYHMRHVLLVASLACGITGVALLVTSGLIYVYRHNYRKQTSSPTTTEVKP